LFICVKLPGAILRCDHTWAAGEGPCGLPCLPLRCCSSLQCVTLVDRVLGRSTWGYPTMSKHPWTPEGSEGARGLLPLPYRSPVVSTVLACSPDGSPEDQLTLDVEWTICVQRASTCRTRNAQCDTGGRERAPRRRRRRMMLRTPTARRALPKAPHLPEPRPILHFRRARPQGKRPPPVVGVTQSADGGFFSFRSSHQLLLLPTQTSTDIRSLRAPSGICPLRFRCTGDGEDGKCCHLVYD
jgi:hypothetical protein